MAADPVLVENTKAWLAKAAKDLRRVEQLISAEEPDYEDAVFHCQQTVEKALKAFLTWHDELGHRKVASPRGNILPPPPGIPVH